MNEEIFNIIGKMYVDFYQMKTYIEDMQKQIQQKDQEILSLKNSINKENE